MSAELLIQLITDALKSKPQTKKEALSLYKVLTAQLGHTIVANLPSAERESALIAMNIIQYVDNVKCSSCW